MSEAAAEKVFYDRDGVRVTSARFQVGAQTFAMGSVSSVAYQKRDASYGASALVGCLGAPFFLLGLISFFGATGKLVALVLLAFGAFLVGGGIVTAIRSKPTYVVSLTTASGQVSALSSPDSAAVEPVVRALNDALVSRG